MIQLKILLQAADQIIKLWLHNPSGEEAKGLQEPQPSAVAGRDDALGKNEN